MARYDESRRRRYLQLAQGAAAEINGKLGVSDIKLEPHSAFLVKPPAKLGASLG